MKTDANKGMKKRYDMGSVTDAAATKIGIKHQYINDVESDQQKFE